ncbi:MAG TPA: hypothetical protein VNO52_04910 [Methylomirabilota bacterium]|nr:hypothetical protein [Methylomirabilota bacterium]
MLARQHVGVLTTALLGLVLAASGCKRQSVSATEPARIITRWKCQSASETGGSVFGLAVEQKGDHITARLFELRGRDGFDILVTYPPGWYDAIRRELIVPLGLTPAATREDYLKSELPYLKFELILSRDRLVGQMILPGSAPSLCTFLRYEPPMAQAR